MLVYRPLESISDLEQVTDLEITVWGVEPRNAVPAALMHASVLSGGVVMGAYDEGRIVGLSYALPARRSKKWMLWSHMTGVHPDYQGGGVGFGLKQAQRTWALKHGYNFISWTFDPLRRGNANFNLHLLGATACVYHADFYGEMTDAINVGLPSDRVEAQWDLRSSRVHSLMNGASVASEADSLYPDGCFLLKVGADNRPLVADFDTISSRWHFVEIPFDLAKLKLVAPDAAYVWCIALRGVLQDAFARGSTLVDFVVSQGRCWYVLLAATPWYLYVVECSDGSLYTGVTLNMQHRVSQHNAGKGAAYTATRRPVKLVAAWQFAGRASALRAEAGFKRLSRPQKLSHIKGKLSYLGAPCLLSDMK